VFNVGQKVITRNTTGYIPSQIAFFLQVRSRDMHVHRLWVGTLRVTARVCSDHRTSTSSPEKSGLHGTRKASTKPTTSWAGTRVRRGEWSNQFCTVSCSDLKTDHAHPALGLFPLQAI
jgi:hypothetical protein